MSSEFILGLACGVVLGAAIIISAVVTGYVGAVKDHAKKEHSDDR